MLPPLMASTHKRGAASPPHLLHRLPSLNGVLPQQPPPSHRLWWARRNAIFSLPWTAQSRSANQAPAPLPAPFLTISSTAFAALTLRRPKSESLSWFHSCSEPSHNEAIVCSSWLTLLYIPAVDRHTNHSGRLSLLLQFRAKQPSLIGTKQTTERQGQRVLLYLPLIYPKEVHNACEHWDLERTLPDKALIEGSQSPRSDNHGRNSPQHTPKKRRTRQSCTNFENAVVQVVQYPGLNNTNCVLSYTSVGDPASNRS